MSSRAEFSENLFYNNLFNEDDEKSRIFDDIENDLLTKLTVTKYIYNIIIEIIKFFKEQKIIYRRKRIRKYNENSF